MTKPMDRKKKILTDNLRTFVYWIWLGTHGIERKFLSHDTKIVVTTRSHETEAVRNAIAACEPTEVLRVGGAGHKVRTRYFKYQQVSCKF